LRVIHAAHEKNTVAESKMNEKRRRDPDEILVPRKKLAVDEVAPKKAHTLDSDEEEEGEPVKPLEESEIEGQEEGGVDYEGETTFTPFNMKEEMEEGTFDKDGYYSFKKDNDIKDPWMEDIDWAKIKQTENKYGSDSSSSEDEEDLLPTGKEPISVYKEILPLLKPGETVTKALKRLGGGKKMSSAQKWKLKKLQKQSNDDSSDLNNLSKLTELSTSIMEHGNMDIYYETYEMISAKIKKHEQQEDPMDMFSDVPKTGDAGNSEAIGPTSVDEVKWMLRMENSEASAEEGPFTSEALMKRQDNGEFDKGAYVKKLEGDTWYNIKRIDFDLYM